ncbi:hypothetical protein [Ensifer sesbaniae]|uniref:hypothetical protein n=1 Tax=Ensifer sesbaniae TaxID=1214071 RepID=UPI0015689E88|nr:hypothetical protein [Ensifer sesbaniae]
MAIETVGAGHMGSGIACAFALDVDAEALVSAAESVAPQPDEVIESGNLVRADKMATVARMATTATPGDLGTSCRKRLLRLRGDVPAPSR